VNRNILIVVPNIFA